MLEGVDVSYAQGNYRPGNEDFVIVNASRANIGLAVGSKYRNQVANARAAGKHVGHYFFNGNVDPVRCANYFVDNLAYVKGDSLWLDVEAEGSTNTPAWSPAQALAFVNQVKARTGVVPGVYLNQSLMNSHDWSAVVATGAPLWIAYYNPRPPAIRWWPTWAVWQYTSTPIDRNRAQVSLTSTAGGNATPINEGALMALTDAEQADLLFEVKRISSGMFKTDPVAGSTTGGNPMPGGLLRMASIGYDWQFGVAGKKIDLLIASLGSASVPVDAAAVVAQLESLKATLAAIPAETVAALHVPTAAENAQAARDAIVK